MSESTNGEPLREVGAQERPNGGVRSSSLDSDKTDSPSGLHIPEAKDGYFGYNEAKSLHHVRHVPATLLHLHVQFRLDGGEIVGASTRIRRVE